jgi:hypothetical protein
MRILLVLASLAVLSACAEAVEGPRIVEYTPDRFYVRHVPWRDSRSGVELLAGAICEQTGKQAALEDAYQYAVLDIRYATYHCIAVERAADAT